MKALPHVRWQSWLALSLALSPVSFFLWIVGLINTIKSLDPHYGSTLPFKATELLFSIYFFLGELLGPLVGSVVTISTDNAAGFLFVIVTCILQSCFWSYVFLALQRRLTAVRS